MARADYPPQKVRGFAKPGYPEAARRAKIQGVVRLECVILANGRCGDPTVRQSLDKVHGLDEEAVGTMRRWRFKPALLDREGVPVRINVDEICIAVMRTGLYRH